LGESARAGNDTGIGSVGCLIESDVRVVCDIALQTGCVTLQHAVIDGRSAGVGVRSGERDSAGAVLDEGARTAHHASVRAVRVLIELGGGVAGDVSLQTVGRAAQRATADGRAAGVGVGPCKREGASTIFYQRPAAAHGASVSSVRVLIEL